MQRADLSPPSSLAALSDAAQTAQKKINRRSLEFPQRKVFDAQCVLDKVKKSYSFDQDCDGDIVAKIVEDRFAGAIARKVQLATEKSEKTKTRLKESDHESPEPNGPTNGRSAVIASERGKSQFRFKFLSEYINNKREERSNNYCDIRDKKNVNSVLCPSGSSRVGKVQSGVRGGAEDVSGRDRAPVHLRQRTSGRVARNLRCRSTPPLTGARVSPWACDQITTRGRLCRTWYGGYGTLYETEEIGDQRISPAKKAAVTTVAALNGNTTGAGQLEADGGCGDGGGGARRRVEGRRRPRPPPSPRLSASTLSLNILPRLSAAVIPLKRGGHARSAATLLEDGPLLAQAPTLRKCETMVALGEPQRAVNRLRVCSRCSSLLSLAGGGSRYSLAGGGFVPVSVTAEQVCEDGLLCKLCLEEVPRDQVTTISHCNCSFCTKCMQAYVEYEIMNGAYDISCPDSKCPNSGVMAQPEVESLVNPELVDKHRKFRLNHEVAMDGGRAFCPQVGCETVCQVGSCGSGPVGAAAPQAVRCPTCNHHFCSACTNQWHAGMDCAAYSRQQAMMEVVEGLPAESDLIKWCPMCRVPIEKDEGCAQMMCKRCKHVFCWYCLASLDDDFLLRHYDKGPCKNKLGHSRASVIWHRAQVLGIFAGFGLLLLVASPLLLLAAPCIVCCKCRLCNSNGGKIDGDDHTGMDIDAEDGIGDEIQKLSPAFDY